MPVLALADIVVALIALLIILGAAALAYVASELVPNVPIIGGAIRNAIVGAFNDVASTVRSWASETAVPIAFLVQGIALSAWWLLYFLDVIANQAIIGVANALNFAQLVFNELYAYINQLNSSVINYAENLFTSAAADAQSAYNEAVSYSTNIVAQAEANAENLFTKAEQDATELYDQAVAYASSLVGPILQDISAVENVLEGSLSSAVAALTAGIASAEQQALTSIGQAITEADATAKALASAAASGVTTALDATAADVLNPALDVILPALDTIATGIPAAVSNVLDIPAELGIGTVTGIASALGVLTAVGAATATEVADCLVPNCASIGAFNGLFTALEDTALWALLLGLVGEAVTDPGAAVTDLAGPLLSTLNSSVTAVVDLVGA